MKLHYHFQPCLSLNNTTSTGILARIRFFTEANSMLLPIIILYKKYRHAIYILEGKICSCIVASFFSSSKMANKKYFCFLLQWALDNSLSVEKLDTKL